MAAELTRKPATSVFTLEQLADRLGLHYTAIYHYFKSRNEIEAELIKQILKLRNARLLACQQSGGSVLEQLEAFIAGEFSEPPTAVLLRFRFLSNPDNPATLQLKKSERFIAEHLREGVREGSIRACDSKLVANLINQVMNRYRNREERLLKSVDLTPTQFGGEVTRIICHGILKDPSKFTSLASIEPVTFPQAFAEEAITEGKLGRIVRALTTAFNSQGYEATSIPRVAASIGLSKTSFYKYGSSKEELLYLCARHSLDLTAQIRQLAKVVTKDPLQELLYNLYFSRVLITQLPGPALFSWNFRALAKQHQLVAWDIFLRWRDSLIPEVEQGIAANEIRPLDPRLIPPFITIFSSFPIKTEPIEGGYVDDIARLLMCGIATEGNVG
jgi:AcrR family transcriptional regulator